MKEYKKGDIVHANITSIEKYGAFAKIDDNYSGLIHISQMTERYVNNINDFFDVGDEVKVMIMDDVVDNSHLKLSIKAIENNDIKRKKKKIKETVFGFYLLEKSLPKWIDEKMKEIDKKN